MIEFVGAYLSFYLVSRIFTGLNMIDHRASAESILTIMIPVVLEVILLMTLAEVFRHWFDYLVELFTTIFRK